MQRSHRLRCLVLICVIYTKNPVLVRGRDFYFLFFYLFTLTSNFFGEILRHISMYRCRERKRLKQRNRLKRSAYICELSNEMVQCLPLPDCFAVGKFHKQGGVGAERSPQCPFGEIVCSEAHFICAAALVFGSRAETVGY